MEYIRVGIVSKEERYSKALAMGLNRVSKIIVPTIYEWEETSKGFKNMQKQQEDIWLIDLNHLDCVRAASELVKGWLSDKKKREIAKGEIIGVLHEQRKKETTEEWNQWKELVIELKEKKMVQLFHKNQSIKTLANQIVYNYSLISKKRIIDFNEIETKITVVIGLKGGIGTSYVAQKICGKKERAKDGIGKGLILDLNKWLGESENYNDINSRENLTVAIEENTEGRKEKRVCCEEEDSDLRTLLFNFFDNKSNVFFAIENYGTISSLGVLKFRSKSTENPIYKLTLDQFEEFFKGLVLSKKVKEIVVDAGQENNEFTKFLLCNSHNIIMVNNIEFLCHDLQKERWEYFAEKYSKKNITLAINTSILRKGKSEYEDDYLRSEASEAQPGEITFEDIKKRAKDLYKIETKHEVICICGEESEIERSRNR